MYERDCPLPNVSDTTSPPPILSLSRSLPPFLLLLYRKIETSEICPPTPKPRARRFVPRQMLLSLSLSIVCTIVVPLDLSHAKGTYFFIFLATWPDLYFHPSSPVRSCMSRCDVFLKHSSSSKADNPLEQIDT